MEMHDQQGQLPFLLTEEEDQGHTIYCCVTGVESLDSFHVVQVVDINSEDGQQVVKEMEVYRDILLSTGRPEDAISDAIDAMFRHDEDKVRFNLIIGSASTIKAGNVDEHEWRTLPLSHSGGSSRRSRVFCRIYSGKRLSAAHRTQTSLLQGTAVGSCRAVSLTLLCNVGRHLKS